MKNNERKNIIFALLSHIKSLFRNFLAQPTQVSENKITQMVETLQQRYYGHDPIVSTFKQAQLRSNIDLICRAFYAMLTTSGSDIHYIASKLAAASYGMRSEERKQIFSERNLFIGDTISYCNNIGHARFYFCCVRSSPYLLISHDYGRTVMNSTEEVLQYIQEVYIEDLGFHLVNHEIPILVKDVSSYYKVRIDVDFDNPEWEDIIEKEQLWFDEQWEYLESKNGSSEEEALFFGKDRPYTAYKYIRRLFKKVDLEMYIIDPYIDDDLFSMLEVVDPNVKIRVLTSRFQADSLVLAKRFRRERGNFETRRTNKLHDRYIILDEQCYLFGSSLNNFGSLPTTIVPMRDKNLTQTVREYFSAMWDESEEIK